MKVDELLSSRGESLPQLEVIVLGMGATRPEWDGVPFSLQRDLIIRRV